MIKSKRARTFKNKKYESDHNNEDSWLIKKISLELLTNVLKTTQ